MISRSGRQWKGITASECDTPEKAKEAVERVIATMDKHRRNR